MQMPPQVLRCWFCWCGLLIGLALDAAHGQQHRLDSPGNYRRGNRLEPRDSVALTYAIAFYANARWAVLGIRTDLYDLTLAQVTHRIDRVFYSPDHARVVLWVAKKMPNAATTTVYYKNTPRANRVCPTGGDTVVSMRALIGIRDDDALWRLYDMDQQTVQCARSANQARPYLERYFFKQMKTAYRFVNKHTLDPAYGGGVDAARMTGPGLAPDTDSPFIPKQYGYNLQDPGFWTNSLVWQRGAMIPGLYLFETRDGAQPGYNDLPLVPPPVPYPASIRQLFIQ